MAGRFLMALLFYASWALGQDPIISQTGAYPMLQNPAMTGTKGGIRIVRGARVQWPQVNGGYITNYFSYDQYSRHLRSGFGYMSGSVVDAGRMMASSYSGISFSPSICVGKRGDDSLRPVVIKPAIYIGFLSVAVNWPRLSFNDMIDPAYGFIYNTNEVKNRNVSSAPDLGSGLMVYGKQFYAGASVFHLTEPEVGLLYNGSPWSMRTSVQGGYLLQGDFLPRDFSLSPSLLFETQQSAKRFTAGLTATYKGFIVGTAYRFGKAFVFMAGYNYRFFKIGYSYDRGATKTLLAFGATHELSLGFNFANFKSRKRIRTLQFPAL